MTSKEEQEEGPVAKKLRSSEPDLSVIVGQGEEKTEYRYVSQVLASHSNYIDAILATPMKESQTMQLSFPDLTPDTWEKMIGFLTDPVKCHNMNFADAIKVTAGYNQYDFQGGLQLCDCVMLKVFERNNMRALSHKPDVDLDRLIDAFLLTDEVNLENAKKEAAKYFSYTLENHGQYGSCMFTECQIEKLAPIIAKYNLLENVRWINRAFTKEDILSPMFPHYFVSSRKGVQAMCEWTGNVSALKLSGANLGTDGVYEKSVHDDSFDGPGHRTVLLDGVETCIRIDKLHDDWVIYGEAMVDRVDDKILWRNPYSRNSALPPRSGWEPVDDLAKGNPKIKYMYLEDDDEV